MIIELEATHGVDGSRRMDMDCYSFNRIEFKTVYNVLEKSKVKYTESEIPPDKYRRIGIRFSLMSVNIEKLEKYLGVKFFSDNNNDLKGAGDAYKCKRMTVNHDPPDCKTIYADDQDSASMLCYIVAKKNNWYSAVAERGACKKKNWFDIFSKKI